MVKGLELANVAQCLNLHNRQAEHDDDEGKQHDKQTEIPPPPPPVQFVFDPDHHSTTSHPAARRAASAKSAPKCRNRYDKEIRNARFSTT